MRRWPTQVSLQTRPIKAWARVLFAAHGNVFVPNDVFNRVGVAQGGAQSAEGFVLTGFKRVAVQTFEFNANRKVVALVLAIEAGHPGMPCPVIAAHQLPQLALSADEKMGRDLLDDLHDGSGLAIKIVTVMFDSETMWSESRIMTHIVFM